MDNQSKQYLVKHGWRLIGRQGNICYWDHPAHQPDLRGAFTTVDAYKHQKGSIKEGCDCIKPPEEGK